MTTKNEIGRSVIIIRTPHAPPIERGDGVVERMRAARWAREENEHEEKIMRKALGAFIDRFPSPVAYTVDGQWERIVIDGAFDTQAQADRFAARAGKIVARWAAHGINVSVQP